MADENSKSEYNKNLELGRQSLYDKVQDVPCKCGLPRSKHVNGGACGFFRMGLTEAGD